MNNVPESFQDGSRYAQMEEATDSIQEAIDSIGEAIESLERAKE